MEEYFSKFTQKGLPGGPNELKAFTEGFVVSSEGQWAYPGMNTLIPNANGRITMQGVDQPVLGIDDLGNEMLMQPGEEYQFPGDSVYEIPMKKGGLVKMPKLTKKNKKSYDKKFSKSINATSRLFTQSELFAKPKSKKNKIFDPNSQYQDGGLVELKRAPGNKFKKDANGKWVYESGAPVTDTMILQELNNGQGKPLGSPVVQNAPKFTTELPLNTAAKNYSKLKQSPRLEDQETANNIMKSAVEIKRENQLYHPEVDFPVLQPKNMSDLKSVESSIDKALGFPMQKAYIAASAASGPYNDPIDNFRHPSAGRYTAEAIADYTGNIPYISPALGFIGANLSGVGHELTTLLSGKDKRPIVDQLTESAEDIYNNYVGSKVGVSDMTPEEKTNYLLKLSYNNQLPDGVVNSKKPSNNMYFKKGENDPGKYNSSYDDGGIIEAELTPEEIEEYRKGGWVVEDLDEYATGGGGMTMPAYEEQLRQLENSIKAGYKGGKWYPHNSVEGGTKTIGYGHKLSGSENYSKGLTTAQVLALQKKDIARHTNIAKSTIDKKYGAGTFDKLPESRKVLLVDYAYNGVLHKFPSFMDATVKGDKNKMLKEYMRYTNGKPLTQRNAWTKSVIEGSVNASKPINTPKQLPAKPAAKAVAKQPAKKPIPKPAGPKPTFSVNETFSYDKRPGAVYKVADNGDWFINLGKQTQNNFVPMNDPTGERQAILKKYAHINEAPLEDILQRINNSGNYDIREDLGYLPR